LAQLGHLVKLHVAHLRAIPVAGDFDGDLSKQEAALALGGEQSINGFGRDGQQLGGNLIQTGRCRGQIDIFVLPCNPNAAHPTKKIDSVAAKGYRNPVRKMTVFGGNCGNSHVAGREHCG
jgi:hypothetical protein